MKTNGFPIIPAYRVRILAVLASLFIASQAHATFHLMQIEQVIGGVNGDTSAQAIQLRMRFAGQTQVGGATLIAYDAAGQNPITLLTFPSNVTTSAAGSRILITSAGFASYETTPIASDFTMQSTIPASYLAAGRVTFQKAGFQNGDPLWSISWGGTSYTGPNTGAITNDADGSFAPPFPGVLPSTSSVALQFTGAFSAMSTNNAADYALTAGAATFTNNGGGSTSIGASTPTPAPGSLGNISTRMDVLTGDNALIGGFIIAGTQPKRVIIRGIGPSLSGIIPGALVDPVLELHMPDGSVVTNDNWKDTQQTEIEGTGIAPTNDSESAIVMTLPANNSAYTAIVRGKNDTTGVGLVEVYDLDHTVDSRLANISTRGFVEAGDNVMIGGTIVTGGTSANVLFRAIGPSLADTGVPNPLADPIMELHDGNGVVITMNDNWRDTQESEIIATTIPPTNNAESAILGDLQPGAYTAIVRGKNNATGVGLVEAYHLVGGTSPTPTPGGPTPTPNPTATPTPNPTPTPGGPTATPNQGALAIVLSSREVVGTGDAIAMNSFVIAGPTPKRVLVRGLGPSLGAIGIPNPLADPTLELRDSGGAVIASNNDWRDTQQAEILATGLAPTNDLESAIVVTLSPGVYKVVLRGNNNGTGTGLNEIYDLAISSSAIAALGTRANVMTGTDALVGGIIMQQGGSVLIRVLGPSMAGAGVTGVLADPTLQLVDSMGTTVASNDNWRSTQEAAIIATGIPPTNDAESAMVQTLTAGSYTAIVSGVSSGTGIGYLQVYALPYSGSVLPVTP